VTPAPQPRRQSLTVTVLKPQTVSMRFEFSFCWQLDKIIIETQLVFFTLACQKTMNFLGSHSWHCAVDGYNLNLKSRVRVVTTFQS
jgi:hypothetical protein